jgi:hypothetical protein
VPALPTSGQGQSLRCSVLAAFVALTTGLTEDELQRLMRAQVASSWAVTQTHHETATWSAGERVVVDLGAEPSTGPFLFSRLETGWAGDPGGLRSEAPTAPDYSENQVSATV